MTWDQYGNPTIPAQRYQPTGPDQMKALSTGPFARMPATRYMSGPGQYYDFRVGADPKTGRGGYFPGGNWGMKGPESATAVGPLNGGRIKAGWGGLEGAWEAAWKMGWIDEATARQKDAEAWASEKARYDAGEMSPFDAFMFEQAMYEEKYGMGTGGPLSDLMGQLEEQWWRENGMNAPPGVGSEWMTQERNNWIWQQIAKMYPGSEDPFAGGMWDLNKGYVDANGNYVNDPNGWMSGWIRNEASGWS